MFSVPPGAQLEHFRLEQFTPALAGLGHVPPNGLQPSYLTLAVGRCLYEIGLKRTVTARAEFAAAPIEAAVPTVVLEAGADVLGK